MHPVKVFPEGVERAEKKRERTWVKINNSCATMSLQSFHTGIFLGKAGMDECWDLFSSWLHKAGTEVTCKITVVLFWSSCPSCGTFDRFCHVIGRVCVITMKTKADTKIQKRKPRNHRHWFCIYNDHFPHFSTNSKNGKYADVIIFQHSLTCSVHSCQETQTLLFASHIPVHCCLTSRAAAWSALYY